MIKPSQIREKEFAKSTMGGYKTSDVDSFFSEIADSYEQLYNENSALFKKMSLLVDNIEQYRKREQDGGLSTDATLSDAKAEADRIVAQARLEAARIISEAEGRVADCVADNRSLDEIRKLREIEEKSLSDIKAEAERFRKSLVAMYTEHLTLIQSMVNAASAAREEVVQNNKETVQEQEEPDTQLAEPEETISEEEIDALFADAVSDEKSRMREAFGGFRFEMGVEDTDEVQLELEQTQEDAQEDAPEEEPEQPTDAESECVNNPSEEPEIIVLNDEPIVEQAQAAQGEVLWATRDQVYQSSQEEAYYDMEIQDDGDDNEDDDSDDDSDDNDKIEPAFKISFAKDEEVGDDEEENLDDLFEEFFNSFDKQP